MDFLVFDRWIIKPKLINELENPKGKKTVTLFKLNERTAIKEKRKELYEMFQDELEKKKLAEAILVKTPNNPDAIQMLKKTTDAINKYKSPSKEFSGILQKY